MLIDKMLSVLGIHKESAMLVSIVKLKVPLAAWQDAL